MCGIVGYVGYRNAKDVLLGGLAKLEYRGYDSAGLAVRIGESMCVRKKAGKLAMLRNSLLDEPMEGHLGIGHTRWATHGRPNDVNAHPHATEDGQLVIIHNGIIENYVQLKQELSQRGHLLLSETDSEVLAHLIEEHYAVNHQQLLPAVCGALQQVRGAYGMVVSHAHHNEIIAARYVSPLVLGIGEGEMFLASDVPALLPYTKHMIFLQDGDVVRMHQDGYEICRIDGSPVQREVSIIDWSPEAAEKAGFDTYMLKEIYEQPASLANTLGGRLLDSQGTVSLNLGVHPNRIDRIQIVGCGTAYYAGLVGEYLIEQLARIPVEVDVASEYRYRDPVVSPNTLVIAISQSGETIDTLEALREAKRMHVLHTIGIVNAKGSTLTREVQDLLYTHAGPEIGVASTKAFTAQIAALLMLALWLARARNTLDRDNARELLSGARELPRLIEQVLESERVAHIKIVAEKYAHAKHYLFMGRGINAPIALEGALKLKEISYIHAEAYAAGEMKHGPIALIDEQMPILAIATHSRLLEKTVSNMQEVRTRGGQLLAVVSDGDTATAAQADDVIWVPKTHELLSPLINVVALQLLAYYSARALGKDVDQPRNLAKSVTVE